MKSGDTPAARYRQYTTHNQLLDVLERNGLDVDDVNFSHLRPRFLDRREAPQRVVITLECRVRA